MRTERRTTTRKPTVITRARLHKHKSAGLPTVRRLLVIKINSAREKSVKKYRMSICCKSSSRSKSLAVLLQIRRASSIRETTVDAGRREKEAVESRQPHRHSGSSRKKEEAAGRSDSSISLVYWAAVLAYA